MKEVLLGIGNILNGDDGIGIYVAEKTSKSLKETEVESKQANSADTERAFIIIDCGTTPENFTSIIKK